MTLRVGILGGMFDPIHRGHADMAAAAQAALGLSAVFVVPANIPPHRPQPRASTFHRFAMVALAASTRSQWRASDIELLAPTPSFTSHTLQSVHGLGYRPQELFFIVGADAFLEIGTWKDYPQILDLAHFVVVSRPTYSVAELRSRLPAIAPRMVTTTAAVESAPEPLIILIDAPTADVSSTAIRRRRREGHSIEGLVDPLVAQYIERQGLYVEPITDRPPNDPPAVSAAGRLHAQSRKSDS
jgi:nicotinate-nucleotide adenylyltransferase